VLADIETLNRAAFDGRYEVTAVFFSCLCTSDRSLRAIAARASMGDRAGPILVARRPLSAGSLKGVTVGIPGD
jgi:1,4-dihydroxy-6-naphthoate synthase